MKAWREHTDPWEEADRLEVKTICRNMGWTKRRLSSEMERVASPEAFIERVQKALKELDAPRLLHRDSSHGYTSTPYMAMKNDPGEAVDEEFQRHLSKAARERERQAGEELVLAALEVRQVLRERVSSRADFRSIAGLSIRRLDKEIDKLIVHTKRKAA